MRRRQRDRGEVRQARARARASNCLRVKGPVHRLGRRVELYEIGLMATVPESAVTVETVYAAVRRDAAAEAPSCSATRPLDARNRLVLERACIPGPRFSRVIGSTARRRE